MSGLLVEIGWSIYISKVPDNNWIKKILVFAFTIYQFNQVLISCSIPSGPTLLPSHIYSFIFYDNLLHLLIMWLPLHIFLYIIYTGYSVVLLLFYSLSRFAAFENVLISV